jgi:hypothetical protein
VTVKELELHLVNLAERYPERVGLPHELNNPDCSDHCIMGQIAHDRGICIGQIGTRMELDQAFEWGYDPLRRPSPMRTLSVFAVKLNNAGVPWGQIPKCLGIVQGEQPAEAAVVSDELVLTAAEA